MATITAADVNKLRTITGAGMMDCKKALVEADGDFDLAIENLRKKGQKVAANRSDRESTEGAAIAAVNASKTAGAVITLNCETDFVAINADFIAFADSIATIALEKNAKTKEEILTLPYNGDITVGDKFMEQVGKIGEKIDVVKYEIVEAANLVAYIHGANRLGVLVALNNEPTEANFVAGKDAAMQVAALNPVAVDKDGVDATTIERELEIAKEQIRAEGKPENMIEKIAQGKLAKFYKDSTLLNQEFVKDGSLTVAQMLDKAENMPGKWQLLIYLGQQSILKMQEEAKENQAS